MLPDNAASYRLQLHEGFGFDDVVGITDYLMDLGITHLYLSPILQARHGSGHGYDVVDHDRLSQDLGGAEAYERLVAAWEPRSIIVDVVPNHMAVDSENRWWWDVLKNGTESRYAPFFDIDWDPSEARLRRSILVPILGDHYGRVLEAGDIQLESGPGGTIVRYHEHVFPLSDGTEPTDIAATNGDIDALHGILEAQHYRLARWTAAGHELNYRRFFAINDLVALRIDRSEVFDATHGFLLSLIAEGAIHGLRIDHIDGLRYPAGYLERLADLAPEVPIWVEKILEGDEQLPTTWPVEGTTGYDFIDRAGGLFIAPDGEKPLTDIYAMFLGAEAGKPDPHEIAHEAKVMMMDNELATDVERLTDLFVRVCEDLPRYRDFTRPELRQALRETLASMPVYRTYADSRLGTASEQDITTVLAATDDARTRRQDLDPEIFDLLADVLLLRVRGEEEEALAMRFQQTSGPVMAKGMEDTFFYIYNRLTTLNEVGGDPLHFSVSVDTFHRAMQRAEKQWPNAMLSSSTHDTKRSEDVRARLSLLSEIPDQWGTTVERWAQMNNRHRDSGFDDRNMEYLLYQTLVGAWPLTRERAVTYMMKASKEAKEHTSWIAPNEAYDAALIAFVESVMGDAAFAREVERFAVPLVEPGRITSLASTLLKITCPGVSDFYQGSEIWDLSLVDPDNRRPVDYDARRRLLARVKTMGPEEAWAAAETGAPKIFMIHRALTALSMASSTHGTTDPYAPLEARGARADHVVAFRRGEAIVVVPRLVMSLEGDWEDTTVALPSGRWSDAFTGTEFETTASLHHLLSRFPVALLTRDER